MKVGKFVLVGLVLGTFAGAILPVGPAMAATRRMYIWMQPPTDTPPNNTCLGGPANLWHGSYDAPGRALDWKATCGRDGTETVYFRNRASASDDSTTSIKARGQPMQQDPLFCGAGYYIDYAWVKIRSTHDATLHGVATYQHLDITSTAYIDIWFMAYGSWSNAVFNQGAIGKTVSDAICGTAYWNGWHVHENNRNTAKWDLWNTSYYNSSGDRCDCHRVDIKDTWTRRLHYTESR